MGRIDSFGLLVATVGAALVSCLLVLMTASEPALATAPPGENGRIAYSGWDGNDYEIYTIPPDGGSPTQLTNTTTHESLPTYSPDGSKIAYVIEYGDGNHDIATIPADGGTPTKMTNNTMYETYPTYSPDGSKIAYAIHDGIDYDLYTIPADGGESTQLTNTTLHESSPVYSPDGSKISYIGQSNSSYSEIYTIPANGGTPTQLTNNNANDHRPTYSPDGSKIAYVSSDGGDDEIYSIPADGGTPTKMTDNTTDEGSPTYSPDGSKVAYTTYTAYGGRNSNEIYAMPAEGGMPTQLTDGSLLSYEPDWGVHSPDTTPPEVGSVKPADGKKGVRRGNNITATFLEKMNPDTLTDSTVFLINTRTGGVVKAQVSCDEPCQTVTINPWTRLAKNTRYKAVITKGAEDLIGHSMVQNKTWTFTTGAR